MHWEAPGRPFRPFSSAAARLRCLARHNSNQSSRPSVTCSTWQTQLRPRKLSLEANPGTVTLDALRGLRRAGFNRISFGVQSFHPGELRQLERIHDPYDVLNAVRWARQAGFDNLNLDLIYGLPEQAAAKAGRRTSNRRWNWLRSISRCMR